MCIVASDANLWHSKSKAEFDSNVTSVCLHAYDNLASSCKWSCSGYTTNYIMVNKSSSRCVAKLTVYIQVLQTFNGVHKNS